MKRSTPVLVTLALLCGGAWRAEAAFVIYDTHQVNGVGELVPNADDGTPNRPAGSLMGNTVIFAGSARMLTSVTLEYGTYHFTGATTPNQTITLSLYNRNGLPDLTGPGTNGNQPGTLIASSSITTTIFNTGITTATLTFPFSVVVPDSLVAIVNSDFIGDANNQTGLIASSNFTPLVGSNFNGDRLWFGTGPSLFASNNTWAQADGGGDPSISNNMSMVFNAEEVVPEPATITLLGVSGIMFLTGFGWRRRKMLAA